MRKLFTFLVSVSLVLTANTGASLADSTRETSLPMIALTNATPQDGYFAESFTWPGGRTVQLFRVSRPEGCPDSKADQLVECALWLTDGTGEYLTSRSYLAQGWNQLKVNLKKPLQEMLSLGPITAVIGTYYNSPFKAFGATPPDDFVLKKSFQINAGSLIPVYECNPFSETIASVDEKEKRQELVENLLFDADGSRNKPIIEALLVGKPLNGVTQAISTKEARIGKATPVSAFLYGEYPESGYYIRTYDKRHRLYQFDCANLVTVRYETYSPFRFGKDGIAMDFGPIGKVLPTDQWLTVGGKTYQVLKSGKLVGYKSGPVKSCKSASSGSYDSSPCFIPSKPGTYDIKVKEQYVGSGNLLITCRSNIYSTNCSTSRDKSVSRTLSGKFTIDSRGIVKGPGWWLYDQD